MRILFVTHSFPRHHEDSAGSFVLRLARALADSGARLLVLAPAGPGLSSDEVIEGIPVRRYHYAPHAWESLAYTGTMAEQVRASVRGKVALAGLLLQGRRAVAEAVSTFNPDVVHAHWWFPSALSAAATRCAPPLVTTLHGSDVRLARRKAWARLLFRRVANRSAEVTAVSRWLADEARAMAPALQASVEPMPVDVRRFYPGGERHKARLLFVGRLNAQKGLHLLLDALAISGSDASLDVVGNGPDRAVLEARARSRGISDRTFFHGELSQDNLIPLYRAATALIIPSEDEGLGLVAVEAQLCETPVIAFRSGGLPDVVVDGETGVLTPSGDVRALAAAMDALLAHAPRGVALGGAGRRAALARFSSDVVAARFRAVYERARAHVG